MRQSVARDEGCDQDFLRILVGRNGVAEFGTLTRLRSPLIRPYRLIINSTRVTNERFCDLDAAVGICARLCIPQATAMRRQPNASKRAASRVTTSAYEPPQYSHALVADSGHALTSLVGRACQNKRHARKTLPWRRIAKQAFVCV